MNWEKIWNTIKTFFKSNVWNIASFLAVLLFGFIAIKLILNLIKKILNASKMEKIAQNFLHTTIKFCLFLVYVLVLISMMGVEISGIITALSALLLAVGMALQSNISNLANGIVIVSTGMFKKGDFIEVAGVSGSIEEINFLFTTLKTSDNKKVTLPNSTIVNNCVTNSGGNKLRRVDFTFSVAYETDVETVKELVKNVMKSNGKVYLEPEPFCRLKVLGASSIDFFANCWCDTEDYWEVYYYVLENVYNEMKKHNISIPYNQLEIRTRTDVVEMPYNKQELPERIEKERPEEKEGFLNSLDVTKMFKKKKKTKTTKKKEENK